MDCANCGNPIRPEAVYCPRCGAKTDAPPPRGTPVADADLSPLERGLVEQLAKSRLDAQQAGDGKLATGIEGLELERGTTEVLQLNEPGPNGAFEVSSEIIARLHHPEYGETAVTDQVSGSGDSVDAALASAAETYVAVTFAALQSLLRGSGPPQLDLTDYKLGDTSSWKLHNGHLQILGEARLAVQMRLRRPPAPVLVLDTLNTYLSERRLHWCKVDASNNAAEGLTTAVTVDGKRSSRGESELRRKLLERGEIPGGWRFRQFFVLTPGTN
jgi:Family of unknown function (DUF6348)/zinc-ribbon domain